MAENSSLQMVIFRLGREEYALDILATRGIYRLSGMRVATDPGVVAGWVTQAEGEIPVVDLRQKFGFTRGFNEQTRVLAVEFGGKTLGLLVDAVTETTRISRDQIDPPPSILAANGSLAFVGIGKIGTRLIILVDPAKLLSAEEYSAVWGEDVPLDAQLQPEKPKAKKKARGTGSKGRKKKEVAAE